MIASGNLIMVILSYDRLSPMGVGGSRLTFYGDCQGMIKLQK